MYKERQKKEKNVEQLISGRKYGTNLVQRILGSHSLQYHFTQQTSPHPPKSALRAANSGVKKCTVKPWSAFPISSIRTFVRLRRSRALAADTASSNSSNDCLRPASQAGVGDRNDEATAIRQSCICRGDLKYNLIAMQQLLCSICMLPKHKHTRVHCVCVMIHHSSLLRLLCWTCMLPKHKHTKGRALKLCHNSSFKLVDHMLLGQGLRRQSKIMLLRTVLSTRLTSKGQSPPCS